MKFTVNGYFPFSANIENKTSKAGKGYLSIGIAQANKKQDGTYESTWFNMIDKRDLLALSALCEVTYHHICAEEAKERQQTKAQNAGAPTTQATGWGDNQTKIEDDIPFN